MGAKRSYRSSLRAEQAAATRRRIVDAARVLFVGQGFATTKLEAVARDAGVALPTLTGYFPNKAALLDEVLRSVVAGASEAGAGASEADSSPIAGQVRRLLRTSDPRDLLVSVAALFRAANERAFELFEILRKAAAVESVIEERRRRGAEDRRRDQALLARHLKRRGVLRSDLSEREAIDVLWLYSSADVYRLLVHDSGWSPERYEQWLAQTLIGSLLGE